MILIHLIPIHLIPIHLIPIHLIPIQVLLLHSLSDLRSFDMYGFSNTHQDTLQGDEDPLRIRVRKNELQAHRVLDVSLTQNTGSGWGVRQRLHMYM